MPGKYRIHAEYELSTEVEPDGRLSGVEDAENVVEYEDESSFDRAAVSCTGGAIVFDVEGESEEDALDNANAALDSAYYSGDGYFEWEIEDYRITNVECIEEPVPPMDMQRAAGVLAAFIRSHPSLTDEQKEAFSFLLDKLTP
jgi:hypothetical protein